MPQFSQNSLAFTKPDAYNKYAAGPKMYGLSGRKNPTAGPVSADGMAGYKQRDRQMQARKQAYLQYMQALNGGNYMSSGYLRGQ